MTTGEYLLSISTISSKNTALSHLQNVQDIIANGKVTLTKQATNVTHCKKKITILSKITNTRILTQQITNIGVKKHESINISRG